MPRCGEQFRPLIDEQRQSPPRRLPMPGKVAERAFDVGEPRGRDLFIMELVDHAPQPLGELERRGAGDWLFACGIMLLDQPREHQTPFQRIDRGRNGVALVDRVERERNAFIEIGVADHRKPRHQQARAARAHKRRLHRAPRTIARQYDQALCESQRTVGVAGDQSGGERVGEGPLDGNGKDGGFGVSHPSARLRSERCSPGCRRRTTAPCATGRRAAPPQSRDPTRCWSKMPPRAHLRAGAAK